MAQVIYSANAIANLQRAFEFLHAKDPAAATTAADAIVSAIGLLERHPLIGRLVRGELRELDYMA